MRTDRKPVWPALRLAAMTLARGGPSRIRPQPVALVERAIEEPALARDERQIRARVLAVGSRAVADDALHDDVARVVLGGEGGTARIAEARRPARHAGIGGSRAPAEQPRGVEGLRDEVAGVRVGGVDLRNAQVG